MNNSVEIVPAIIIRALEAENRALHRQQENIQRGLEIARLSGLAEDLLSTVGWNSTNNGLVFQTREKVMEEDLDFRSIKTPFRLSVGLQEERVRLIGLTTNIITIGVKGLPETLKLNNNSAEIYVPDRDPGPLSVFEEKFLRTATLGDVLEYRELLDVAVRNRGIASRIP